MSNKIGGMDGGSASSAVGAGRGVQRPQDAATGSAGSSTNGSAGNESVQITGAARQLAGLEQAIRDLPAVNDARVAQISDSIQQGTYSVNSRHIAHRPNWSMRICRRTLIGTLYLAARMRSPLASCLRRFMHSLPRLFRTLIGVFGPHTAQSPMDRCTSTLVTRCSG